MIEEFNVIIAGVGGQGGLTLSRIIAEAAMLSGYEVRIGETLGMSQRFGSVVSFIRFGTKVSSPLISFGHADVLLGLEPLEAARVLKYVNGNRTLGVVNIEPIPPVLSALSVIKKWGNYEYPPIESLLNVLKGHTKRFIPVKGSTYLKDFKAMKSLNILILGIFAAQPENPIKVSNYEKSIPKVLRKEVRLNIEVFKRGYEIGQKYSSLR